MPSPFPGMDPFLEDPAIFPDFHHRYATELSSALNRQLPRPYYARVEMRPELGIVDEDYEPGPASYIIPDLMILKRPLNPGGSTATLTRPVGRVTLSRWVEFEHLGDEPARHFSVEIRDGSRGHKLITLIEILSPSNKKRGPDRTSYQVKQRQILESDASLIEIDLLRGGSHILPSKALEQGVSRIDPAPDYLVMVSRAWNRSDDLHGYIAFPIPLRESLPCIPIPLKDGEPEIPLDLQLVFDTTYDTGPYNRGAVDYAKPPRPALNAEDTGWLDGCLRSEGLAG